MDDAYGCIVEDDEREKLRWRELGHEMRFGHGFYPLDTGTRLAQFSAKSFAC